ncbi:reverse transcriptase domain-containing protein [Tanacetum coccineum]
MAQKKRTTRLNPKTTPTAIAANTTTVTNAQLQTMIDQGVIAILAARNANTNGVDSHNSGTGDRRNERATRDCTYPDFMKCQPLNFKGTEGVVKFTQWVKKIETVFRISNYFVENQIKFSTCTLLGNALTWWNSHIKTVGNDIAYAITWAELKKKMTDKYCPRTEIKKLEVELWELKVKIEKYVGGLPDMIHGSVVASKPKTMQEATEMATEVMDKRIRTFVDRQTENKRKQDDNQQQQQNKRQNISRAYTAGTGEKKPYGGSKPLCAKCNYHHDGPCAPKCHKCNRVGHLARDCRSPANTNASNNQRGTELATAEQVPANFLGYVASAASAATVTAQLGGRRFPVPGFNMSCNASFGCNLVENSYHEFKKMKKEMKTMEASLLGAAKKTQSMSESNGPSKDDVEGVKEGEECQSSNGSHQGKELEKNGLSFRKCVIVG